MVDLDRLTILKARISVLDWFIYLTIACLAITLTLMGLIVYHAVKGACLIG